MAGVELGVGYVALTVSAKGIKGDIERELGQPVAQAAKDAEQSATKSLQSTGAGFTKFGIGALAVAGVVGAGLLKTGQSASNLGESINAVNVTFGEAAGGILKLGENAAKSVGLSNTAFNGLAVQFSSFATTVAGKGGDVVGVMGDMTTRAADFASVMNIEVADAAAMFQSGLAGETEPLKKFGLDLSAAAVNAYAAANGIGAVGAELTESEKVTARYGLLMESTAKTQGDFANTADSAANATRIAKAEMENASASLGASLTPAMAFAASTVASLAGGFAKLNDATGGWLGKGAGIAVLALGAAGAVSVVVGQVTKFKGALDTVRGSMTNAEGGLTKMGSAASKAGPLLAIAAVAAVGLGLRARSQAEHVNEMTKAIGDLSRAADADVFGLLMKSLAQGMLAGKDATEVFGQLAETNLAGAKRALELAEAQGVSEKITIKLREAIVAEEAALKQEVKTTDAAATSTSAAAVATDTLSASTIGATKSDEAYSDALSYAAGAADRLAAATAEAARKADAHSAALQGQIDKLNTLYPKEYDAVTAKYDYARQTEDTMLAVDNLNTTLGDHTAKQDEVKAATDAARDAILQQSEKYATLNGAALGSQGAIARQITSLEAQRDALAPTSPLRTYLNGYIGDLARIQERVDTEVVLHIVSKYNAVNPNAPGYLPPGGRGATGGWRSGLTLVGELGPELVDMGNRSYIHTAAETRQMMAPVSTSMVAAATLGQGGGAQIVLHNYRKDPTLADLNHLLAMARLT